MIKLTKEQKKWYQFDLDAIVTSIGITTTLSILAKCLKPRPLMVNPHVYDEKLHNILQAHSDTCRVAAKICKKRIKEFHEVNKCS